MTLFDRKNLATCTIEERYPLTRPHSTKETWHITLDISQTSLQFQPGDSVGIYAQNDLNLVSQLIDAIGVSAQTPIVHKRTGKIYPIEEFLLYHANLNRITSSFLKLIHKHHQCPRIEDLLQDREALRTYLPEKEPLDLIRAYPNIPLQPLIDQFGPLLPRFYSIASCGKTHPDTLDLTVARFAWTHENQPRFGVASHFLCDLAIPRKTPIPLFVQPAPHFRLPEHPETSIIMVGPGTGIAPFRAFLQQRHFTDATGNHWLFFGERNRSSDYFYADELASYPNLRIDTAFSRDGPDKLYVQHRMLEQSTELYNWLERGAYLYICGDAKKMAKSVEIALLQILQNQGAMTELAARARLKQLKKSGRYLLDVY